MATDTTDAEKIAVLGRIPIALRNLWYWQGRLGQAHTARAPLEARQRLDRQVKLAMEALSLSLDEYDRMEGR